MVWCVDRLGVLIFNSDRCCSLALQRNLSIYSTNSMWVSFFILDSPVPGQSSIVLPTWRKKNIFPYSSWVDFFDYRTDWSFFCMFFWYFCFPWFLIERCYYLSFWLWICLLLLGFSIHFCFMYFQTMLLSAHTHDSLITLSCTFRQ